VIPDIKIEPEEISPITISLITENVLFDFATKFVYENKSISSVDEFEITDKTYSDFVAFALEQNFSYQTQSEKELLELERIVKREKYFERAKNELEMLKNKLANNKESDLQSFKTEISEFLLDEIIGRYYYEEGQLKSSIKDDKQVDKAIEILKDKSVYSSILNGTYHQSNSEETKLSLNE